MRYFSSVSLSFRYKLFSHSCTLFSSHAYEIVFIVCIENLSVSKPGIVEFEHVHNSSVCERAANGALDVDEGTGDGAINGGMFLDASNELPRLDWFDAKIKRDSTKDDRFLLVQPKTLTCIMFTFDEERFCEI